MNNNEMVLNRFVIATFDNPTKYLLLKKGVYYFVDNLLSASKTEKRKLAEEIKQCFYLDTGLKEVELVILPIKVTYELINETMFKDQ